MTTDQAKSGTLIRIVDDDEEVRDALSFMLACRGWRSVAYDSAEAFLREYCSVSPGCVLLDIAMPGMTGVELQAELGDRQAALPIVFITGHGDISTAVKTVKAGAFDFLEKPVDGELLEGVIERAVAASVSCARGVLPAAELAQRVGQLSRRERDVLRLLREDLSNREMAERLGLSERTVEGHRNNVYRKLAVHNRAQLLAVLDAIGQDRIA